MTAIDLLKDAYGRVRTIVHSAVKGASAEALSFRPDADANSIAWLVWHLSRGEDAQIAAAAGQDELWVSDGWAGRFDLPFDVSATGYGQSTHEVAAVRASATLLTDYYDAVNARSLVYLDGLDEDALAEVIDTAWNPPVTRAVRLVSIVADNLQHAGQASYLRGITKRAGL